MALDQVPVDGKTNEMASFADFFDDLVRVYGAGDLFEVVTVDAAERTSPRVDFRSDGASPRKLPELSAIQKLPPSTYDQI